jgi:hypothetical protein
MPKRRKRWFGRPRRFLIDVSWARRPTEECNTFLAVLADVERIRRVSERGKRTNLHVFLTIFAGEYRRSEVIWTLNDLRQSAVVS